MASSAQKSIPARNGFDGKKKIFDKYWVVLPSALAAFESFESFPTTLAD